MWVEFQNDELFAWVTIGKTNGKIDKLEWKMWSEYVEAIIKGTYLSEIVLNNPLLFQDLLCFNKNVLVLLVVKEEIFSEYLKYNPKIIKALVYANADFMEKLATRK